MRSVSDADDIVARRFGEGVDAAGIDAEAASALAPILGRASCRRFRADPVPGGVLRTIGAAALSAPSKSDLQGRDVVVISDPAQAARLKALVAAQGWIAGAPAPLQG